MQKIRIDKQTVVFFSLAAIITLEFFLLLPWSLKRLIDLNRKINVITQQIKTTEIDWPNLDEYSVEKNKLNEEINAMQSKFILSQQVSKSLSFISAISKKFNVEIKSFFPEASQEYTLDGSLNLAYLPISIKAKADFHNLALFLDYLQNSQYFFDLNKIKITSDYPGNSIEMVLCVLVEK